MVEINTKIIKSEAHPFFLVGCLRSGTTLLRLLLGHHPSICKCYEFDFSVDFLKEGQVSPILDNYHHYLERNRVFRGSAYKIDCSLNYAELLHSFLSQRQLEDARPIVGATVHHNIHRLVEIWPAARFIYIRRDPRNVSRSIVNMGWAGTTWHGTLPWNKVERQWDILKNKIDSNQYIEIQYEDLMADTTNSLRKILKLLSLDFMPEMMEIEKDTTYKKPNQDAAGSWVKTATEEEIQLAEACAGRLLIDAGYEHSSLPLLQLSTLEKKKLDLRDRFYRIKFSIKRYGLFLWLGAVISRRLPFEALNARMHFRIDEITTKHLK